MRARAGKQTRVMAHSMAHSNVVSKRRTGHFREDSRGCFSSAEVALRTDLLISVSRAIIWQVGSPKHLARTVHDLYFEPRYD